jgi:hypothetical protein
MEKFESYLIEEKIIWKKLVKNLLKD